MNTLLTRDARALSDRVVAYLRQNGHAAAVVPKVQKLLTRVTAQARKEKTAVVMTSVAMSASEKGTLTKTLEKILGHEVVVENVINAEVIGGMKIQVGDWVVDTTLASQLSGFSLQLTSQ